MGCVNRYTIHALCVQDRVGSDEDILSSLLPNESFGGLGSLARAVFTCERLQFILSLRIHDSVPHVRWCVLTCAEVGLSREPCPAIHLQACVIVLVYKMTSSARGSMLHNTTHSP